MTSFGIQKKRPLADHDSEEVYRNPAAAQVRSPLVKNAGAGDAAWISAANECVQLKFPENKKPSDAQDGKDAEIQRPDFTYPFFGEDELIYGFKDLQVTLEWTARYRLLVQVGYATKKAQVRTESTLLQPMLSKLFPSDETEDSDPVQEEDDNEESDDEEESSEDGDDDRPRHIRMEVDDRHWLELEDQEWTRDAELFAKWKQEDEAGFKMDQIGSFCTDSHAEALLKQRGSTGDLRLLKCHSFDESEEWRLMYRRLRPLLLFYIEGSSYIDDSDPRWNGYLLVREDSTSVFEILGFMTVYPFYVFPDQRRVKISQVLVLPQYQGRGYGGILYDYLYLTTMNNEKALELCVESPSEGFSTLRIRHDLRYILTQPADSLPIQIPSKISAASQKGKGKQKAEETEPNTPFPDFEARAAFQRHFKLSKEHATVILELLYLYWLTRENDSGSLWRTWERSYRIWVKKRLYKKNEEALDGMASGMVKEKLEETYQNVLADYRETLDSFQL